MYINVVTCVRACDGESDTFSIKIGLHQGSALGPYIFHLSDGRDHKRHTRRYFLVYTLCWWCGVDWWEQNWSQSETRVVEINFRIERF
jgi:hypothetical protein